MVGIHACSVCKKEEIWNDRWEWYGSYAMLETLPNEVPKLCSELCREAFQDGLGSGEITMRNVRASGYHCTITGCRSGY